MHSINEVKGLHIRWTSCLPVDNSIALLLPNAHFSIKWTIVPRHNHLPDYLKLLSTREVYLFCGLLTARWPLYFIT